MTDDDFDQIRPGLFRVCLAFFFDRPLSVPIATSMFRGQKEINLVGQREALNDLIEYISFNLFEIYLLISINASL